MFRIKCPFSYIHCEDIKNFGLWFWLGTWVLGLILHIVVVMTSSRDRQEDIGFGIKKGVSIGGRVYMITFT